MGLVDALKALGTKIRIIEVAPKTGSVPAPAAESAETRLAMRAVTLAELETEIREDEIRSLAEVPAELSVPLDSIFDAAGMKPPAHGWTVEKLRDSLKAAGAETKGREAAQATVLAGIALAKCPVEDIVKDALARDRALDAFHDFVRKKVGERQAVRLKRVTELQGQVREVERQIEGLQAEARADEERWREWHRKKTSREKEMAWAIGFVMDRPVVTVDEEPDKLLGE